MQAELEKLPQWLDEWIDENSELGHDNKQWVIAEGCLRALLSRFVLCDAEPIGYLYQHEDTGMTTSVDVQQVGWGFEKNNPRFTLIGPLHKPLYAPVSLAGNADISPQGEAGKEGGKA